MNKDYREIKTVISEEEAQQMIERVARFIVERGLGAAGILVLESLHPLHGIASQAMYFVLPFAEMVFDSQKYQNFALMLQNEDYLKRLIRRVDELDEEINRERRSRARLISQGRRNRRRAWIRKLLKKEDKTS